MYPTLTAGRLHMVSQAVGAAHAAAGSPLLRTVTLNASPVDLAVDERTRHDFVAVQDNNPGQSSIVMLDARNGAILHTFRLDGGVYPALGVPGAHVIAVDGQTSRLFVLTEDSEADIVKRRGTISVLDAAAGRLLRTVAVGHFSTGVFADSHLGRVYATTEDMTAGVSTLDAMTGRLLHSVRGIATLAALTSDDATGRVFVTGGTTGIYVLNATTGVLLRTVIPHSDGCTLSVDPLAGRVIVSNAAGRFTSTVSILDAATGAVLQERTVNISSGTCPALADEATGHTFMVRTGPYDTLGYSVDMLDTRTGQELQSVHVPAPPMQNAQVHLAIDARTSRVFAAVTSVNVNDVLVLGTHTEQLLATIPVGTGPLQVAVSEATGRVFVANAGDNTISVLDASAGRDLAPQGRLPVDPVPASHSARYFPRTGHNMSGLFLAFWNKYGGITTFGYPRTEPFTENGHLVQYTDRFLLELVHGQVQAAPLGRLLTQGRAFPAIKPFASTANRQYFPATGHSLSGRFLAWWRTHHGAILLGKPISEVIVEGNGDGSGRRYPLQWFEKGRLEYHPELAGTRYALELGLLPVQALQRKGWLP